MVQLTLDVSSRKRCVVDYYHGVIQIDILQSRIVHDSQFNHLSVKECYLLICEKWAIQCPILGFYSPLVALLVRRVIQEEEVKRLMRIRLGQSDFEVHLHVHGTMFG